jgi:hypothetical protein
VLPTSVADSSNPFVEQADTRLATSVHNDEPGTSVWRRLGVRLLVLLPIECLL